MELHSKKRQNIIPKNFYFVLHRYFVGTEIQTRDRTHGGPLYGQKQLMLIMYIYIHT